jgi:hypothetical protein
VHINKRQKVKEKQPKTGSMILDGGPNFKKYMLAFISMVSVICLVSIAGS